MVNNHRGRLRARTSLTSLAIAAAFSGWVSPAQSFEFTLSDGEIKGAFDTTVSYGVLMRAQGRDPGLIGTANGGTAASVNEDDTNKLYRKNDVVSSLFKVSHDLDLSYKNYGFFARALYFYDEAVDRKSGLSDETRRRLVSDFRLLDFYGRASFEVGEKKLNVRLGNQVVNWGESTFIGNGINIINPIDVARLRAPGSELKEGLLPQEMLWASQELTDNISVEGFVQFKHRKTRIDPRGSFFSNNDFASPGGDTAFFGFGQTPDSVTGTGAAFGFREADRPVKDSGQFGLATRVFLPELNNTELGLFYARYHSRTPFLGSFAGLPRTAALGGGTPGGGPAATFFLQYPEDIDMYGLSLSGSGPFGISLQGEYSYRPNQPVAIASVELLLASLTTGTQALNQAGVNAAATPAGTRIDGFRRVRSQQIQMTATKSFGPVLGSSQLTAVAEAGYTHQALPDGIRFNGPGTSLPANNALGNGVNIDGYATRASWGYRAVLRAEYPNAIGPVTLAPRLVFSHDVKGVSANFNEGAKAVTIGLSGSFKQNWQADIAYTNFFGGRTYSGVSAAAGGNRTTTLANPLADRDFLSATISYSF